MALFKVRPFPVPIAQCCIGDVAAEIAAGAAMSTIRGAPSSFGGELACAVQAAKKAQVRWAEKCI